MVKEKEVFFLYLKKRKLSIAKATVYFYSEKERKKGCFIPTASSCKWYNSRTIIVRFEQDFTKLRNQNLKREHEQNILHFFDSISDDRISTKLQCEHKKGNS